MTSNGPHNDDIPQPTSSELIILYDQEIRDLENRLFSLRIKRNALIPIQQFPTEAFERILSTFGRKRGGSKELVSFALVSRYWRDIIFGSKGLWTLIDDLNIARADWIHQHSNPFPISLYAENLDKSAQNILQSASQRLQTIHVSHIPFFPTQFPKDGWVETFPILQSLILDNFTRIPIFLSKMPSILSLSMIHCQIQWKPIVGRLSTLTSLTILNPLEKISLRTFIKSLDQLPNLGNLILKDAFVSLGSNCNGDLLRSTNTTTPVFPQLSLLKISEIDPWVILQLLRHGHCITPSTSISVSLRRVLGANGVNMDASQYLEGLQEVFARLSKETTSITADQSDRDSSLTRIVLRYASSRDNGSSVASLGRGRDEEESQVTYYQYTDLSGLLDGGYNISLTNLRAIHLDSSSFHKEKTQVRASAHRYPNLKVLFTTPSPTFLELFSLPNQEDGHVAWHYPSLEVLGIVPHLDERGIQALESVLTSYQRLSQGKKLKVLILDKDWEWRIEVICSRLEGFVEEIILGGTERLTRFEESLGRTVREGYSIDYTGVINADHWLFEGA